MSTMVRNALIGVGVILVIAAFYFLLARPYMEAKDRGQARIIEQVAKAEKAKQEFAAKQAKEAEEQAAREAKAVAEEAAKLKMVQEMATVRQGEGVEHALIRQLVDNPGIMNGIKVKIGEKEYDLAYSGESSEKKAVKKWAQSKAHLIAIASGYVHQNTGRQIRIKKPNEVAFILKAVDSKFNIDIYKKELKTADEKVADAEFGSEPCYSIGGLGVDYQATFWADVKNVGFYEYIWTPARE